MVTESWNIVNDIFVYGKVDADTHIRMETKLLSFADDIQCICLVENNFVSLQISLSV